jgi:signal transduction histidine kinase
MRDAGDGSEAAPVPGASGARRLSVLVIGAAVAVCLAEAWNMMVARRRAHEEAQRAFASEVAARARTLEAGLAAVRADLAFLAASSPAPRLALGTPGAGWSQGGAEGALLLFLRGHPEVVRVAVLSPSGEPLFHAGRRGGVPLLWVATRPTGREGAALAPDRVRLSARLAWHGGPQAAGEPLALEIEVEPALLLPEAGGEGAWSCRLHDATGRLLARHSPGGPSAAPGGVDAEAPIRADGWSASAPWRLSCAQPASAAMARVESVSARYHSTLLLNLGVMALAFALGGYAWQQARRRERLEARSREEGRVRELERQLFHAERLSTVGRLAAGIAHELNNPLEGMSNWLSLARDALARDDPQHAAAHLARVKEGLEHAAGIVRQVLAHADPARAPQTSVDLNEVLGDAARLVQSRREFQGIVFGLELAREPQLVRGSPVMLGQVAINLVLNACEAQPGGGEVRVRTRREGAAVVAEIADRGPGVAEADRERIFEPFFSTKDSTGLGLSICHGIVSQHRGELSVRPRDGGGAVFRLSLPAAAAGLREAS